ncbi:alpha/beta hydrolase [Taibaiella soli]|uniref:Alpha/beta hydrolase n=1 Tax=Taibaiella soli TaxID=1649169 RepID=A0A2W2A983_9BACT|nr:alpha/beta hydrolase [Taibaiella soli]PZF71905.1 alpha/beta hydrolase [Taibaiella soli]
MNTNTKPVKSGFTTQEVSFLSNGLKLAGILHVPQTANPMAPSPAIVIGHPGTAVKEQTAGLYAHLLAERGFVTLTFDAAYQGESEGMPRGLEDPAQRTEDIKAAVSYLSTLQIVDADRTGVLGICASGGYGVSAAATDPRIKAIATVSAADVGRQFRNGGDGTQDISVIQNMLYLAAQARTATAKGAQESSFPIFPETEEQAKAMGLHVYEGWKYYCTEQGQHPRSAKTFTWSSVDKIAGFDAFRFADMIAPRPLLMIVGSEAVTKWMTEDALEVAKEPKELFVIDGATHVDLYYNERFVIPAVTKLEQFFTKM